MSTAGTNAGIRETSPLSRAKIAGVCYLLTFVTGGAALFLRGPLGLASGLIAGACYVGVTLLFYYLFKPVSRGVSLFAAIVSLIGVAIGPLGMVVHAASRVNPLVIFGFYCLLIGFLILRSAFLPPILGILMAIAGLSWLTFVSPSLARSLEPWNFAAALTGEGALTLWLLVKGVNVQRWKEQAATAFMSAEHR